MGPGTAIVLNTPRAVRKLLHARSATTSNRPPNHFIHITSSGYNVGSAQPENIWKTIRRVFSEMLTREACMNNLPIQKAEATQLMHDLVMQPEVRLYSIS